MVKLRYLKFIVAAFAFAAVFHFSACQIALSDGVRFSPGQEIFKHLSQYQLFRSPMSDLNPNESVLAYDLISPLFSDYAQKARFIWMPEGTSAKYTESEVFDFPVGTILVKNFLYADDINRPLEERRILETRLLIHEPEGWTAHPYVWNEEQTEATLEITGGKFDVSWSHYDGTEKELRYKVPNKSQCKGCHIKGNSILPIGPKARNLNKTFSYEDGEMNQLEKWTALGLLTGAPETSSSEKMVAWDDVDAPLHDRAMAYLEMNCGHCHNEDGPANTSGLHLISDETDPDKIGICKVPIAAGRGSGGFLWDIVPGNPDESILLFRMDSDDPGIMMPEVGRRLIHTEGVELIRNWIASMEGGCEDFDLKLK